MVYMIPSECGSVHISEAGRPIQAKIREQERDIRLTCTFAIPLMKVKIHLLLFNWQIVNNIPSLNKNALICAGRPIQAKIREQERDIRLTCTFAIPLMKVKIHLLLFNWQIVNNIPSLNKNALICVLSKVFFDSILIALCYMLLPARVQTLLTRHALLSFSEFALLFCFKQSI